jgi:hypothetical protein
MKSNSKSHAVSFDPDDRDIQQSAYELWQREGKPMGRDLEFWLTAKETLRHRVSIPTPLSGQKMRRVGQGVRRRRSLNAD